MMPMLNVCYLVSLVCALPLSDSSANPTELFVAGNAAYENGNYPAAIEAYEELASLGYDSGWITYNLGNSYLRTHQLGRAIGNFRRSLSALPRNGDVRANLVFARERTQDAIAPPEPAPVVHTLFFWHYVLSYRELALVTAVLNGLFWLAFGLRQLRPDNELLRWGAALLLVGVLALLGSLLVRTFWPTSIAVVTAPEITVHSGTHRDTVVRFKLHDGTEAHILDSQDNWLRIELSDGKQGWVSASDVSQVSL